MSQKNEIISDDEIFDVIFQKIIFYEDVIKKTFLSLNEYKKLSIIGSNEINFSINELNVIMDELRMIECHVKDKTMEVEHLVNDLQILNNKLSNIIKLYGTNSLEHLITICFGNDYFEKHIKTETEKSKYELLVNYAHPINYKVIQTNDPDNKEENKNPILEDIFTATHKPNLFCYLNRNTNDNYNLKLYSLKLVVKSSDSKNNVIITCVVEPMMVEYLLSNQYLYDIYYGVKDNLPKDGDLDLRLFNVFYKSLSLQDFLINTEQDIFEIYRGFLNAIKIIKNRPLSKIISEFIKSDLIGKRKTLIQLLLDNDDTEFQYLAYLLYDSISSDDKNKPDTVEQNLLFDSLPWNIKINFKSAMKETIEYTHNLLNNDTINKVPLEQRICLLKVSDSVKEKAMMKLKEVKSKSDDSTSKARQWLEGLLKIPFSIYRNEPVFDRVKDNIIKFKNFIKSNSKLCSELKIDLKDRYNNIEVYNGCQKVLSKIQIGDTEQQIIIIRDKIGKLKKNKFIELINYLLTLSDVADDKSLISILNNNNLKTKKGEFYKLLDREKNTSMISDIICYLSVLKVDEQNIFNSVNEILLSGKFVNNYMKSCRETLDSCIYGHNDAKRQIERIIGQWINGKSSGYCLGFEGPPGVGKCLAKNTPIMLSNGKIKMVQDITLKDKLMGDDGFERNVLALGSGREKMYRIEQVKGDDYVVNESHILSLKMSKAGRKGDKHQTILGKRYYKDDIVDICIKDYLGLPKYLKECLKGYKVGLNFREQEVSLDPYAIGYWLGDGNEKTFRITTIENEVVEYFTKYASENGLQLTRGKEGTKNDITYHITSGIKGGNNYKRNFFLNSLKQYNLINNKHIPEEYKLTTRENRLSLLAGLIDSDGYHNPKNNSLEITQMNKVLADDIVFLVRSLGMRAMIKECEKSCTYKGEKKCGIYHRITISGSGLDEIPVLLERKKARPNNQKKNCLNTGIKIVPLEEDKYYGFQIDGNSRFLLGDFTVTHNTSLAKRGLSNCLKDNDGFSRPFSFIAIGGSSNGSTLEGHSYTYVGSQWGKIVDILMDTKCMNPIIFIDEIDKVSRTESGKEIISILTHLIDPTQNDTIQDKYFSGIDLDLSKVLFVFSYNDVSCMDKILLDRIHRIKFQHLNLDEKLIICNDHILPELYEKMGQYNTIYFSDEILKYIIEEYTCESGVRKLKEILFEIIGEVNLEILNSEYKSIQLPLKLSEDDIKDKYLKNRVCLKEKKIHDVPKVGIMNGLWANSLGRGGIIQIESTFIPLPGLIDLKLTGQQGDVMKESMEVAKSLAWKLSPQENKEDILKKYEKMKTYGIHIHCPDGGTPKDGPSAGTAITVCLYSLINNIKIKNNIAITGEINMQGGVTAIGGLDLKILGGIKAGVTKFLYPKEN